MDLAHMGLNTPPPLVVDYVLFYSNNIGIYHEREGNMNGKNIWMLDFAGNPPPLGD